MRSVILFGLILLAMASACSADTIPITGTWDGGADGDGILTILGLELPYFYAGGSFSGLLNVHEDCTLGMRCSISGLAEGRVCAFSDLFCDDPATLDGELVLAWSATTLVPVTTPDWVGTAVGTFSGTLIGFNNPFCLGDPNAATNPDVCDPAESVAFSGTAVTTDAGFLTNGPIGPFVSLTGTATPIPEPSSLLLCGIGALAVALIRAAERRNFETKR